MDMTGKKSIVPSTVSDTKQWKWKLCGFVFECNVIQCITKYVKGACCTPGYGYAYGSQTPLSLTLCLLFNEGMQRRGGGLPLSITANPRPIGLLNVCIRANTCVHCLFLSLYTAFMVKTGTQQCQNKRPPGKGGG